MKNIAEIIASYQACHKNKVNILCHFLGVPLIIFSLQLTFSTIPFSFFNNTITIAWLFIMLLLLYYVLLDRPLAIMAMFYFIPSTLYAELITHTKANLIFLIISLFVTGWIFQFIGHFFEKKQPAFLSNIFQIFTAPLFLLAEISFFLGYRKKLKQKIHDS